MLLGVLLPRNSPREFVYSTFPCACVCTTDKVPPEYTIPCIVEESEGHVIGIWYTLPATMHYEV